MEIATTGMTMTKIPLINLMTTIYFTNHQKGQLVDFLKKYPCVIYVKNALNVNFKSLHSKKNQKCQHLTLKSSKWGNCISNMFSLRDIIKIVSDQ